MNITISFRTALLSLIFLLTFLSTSFTAGAEQRQQPTRGGRERVQEEGGKKTEKEENYDEILRTIERARRLQANVQKKLKQTKIAVAAEEAEYEYASDDDEWTSEKER